MMEGSPDLEGTEEVYSLLLLSRFSRPDMNPSRARMTLSLTSSRRGPSSLFQPKSASQGLNQLIRLYWVPLRISGILLYKGPHICDSSHSATKSFIHQS